MSAEVAEKPQSSPQLPSAFELFKPGARALWLNIGPLLAIVFVPAFLIGILFALTFVVSADSSSNASPALIALIGVLVFAFILILIPATYYLQLMGAQAKKVTIGETIQKALHFMLRMFGLSIVVGFIIIIGLILFIVPGLFMIRRYMLSSYYLMDRELGIFEAMRQSAADSKKYSGAIWGLIGVTAVVQVVGLFISFVPVVGTVAANVLSVIYSYAPAVRYQQINAISSKKS